MDPKHMIPVMMSFRIGAQTGSEAETFIETIKKNREVPGPQLDKNSWAVIAQGRTAEHNDKLEKRRAAAMEKAAADAEKKAVECVHFLKGRCFRTGNRCGFAHTAPPEQIKCALPNCTGAACIYSHAMEN